MKTTTNYAESDSVIDMANKHERSPKVRRSSQNTTQGWKPKSFYKDASASLIPLKYLRYSNALEAVEFSKPRGI